MARYFGKQTFISKNKTSTTFYSFPKKEDLEAWLKSDIKAFDPGADKSQRRSKATEKAFKKHMQADGNISAFVNFYIKKPSPEHSFVYISHPNHKKDFGVVIEFQNSSLKSEFMNQHRAKYKGNISELKATDSRVITAAANRLFLKHNDKDPNFSITLNSALKNYPQLNPAKRHLAVIFQKDYSIPEVYSFDIKPFRDKFVATLKNKVNKEKLPIVTGKLANFHPIAIDKATKGQILEGNLTDHFRHLKEYLSYHNSKDLKPDAKLEKMTTHSFKKTLHHFEGEALVDAKSFDSPAVFKNKDLKSVNFNDPVLKGDIRGFHFENCTFKDMDLSGIDFHSISGSKNDFSGCNLSNTNFSCAKLKHCDFKNSHSKGGPMSFDTSKLMECDFKYSNHKGVDFSNSKISRTNFYKSDLPESNFGRIFLSGSDLNQTNLSKARFDSNASDRIERTTFKGANLTGTSLSGSKLNTGIENKKGPVLAS